MSFKTIYAFTTSLKGKQIRFRQAITAENLSNKFGLNKNYSEEFQIPAGALGVIYEVRGGTLYVGFGHNVKVAPSRSLSATFFAATAQIHIEHIDTLEVEA